MLSGEMIRIDLDTKLAHGKITGSLQLFNHQVTLLTGENGVGKTSLFRHFFKHRKELFSFTTFFLQQDDHFYADALSGQDLYTLLEKNSRSKISSNKGMEFLQNLGQTDLLKKKVDIMSGGQRQLLKLSLVISIEVDYFFLDEPFNHIDSQRRKILRDILTEQSKGFFIIDHLAHEWKPQQVAAHYHMVEAKSGEGVTVNVQAPLKFRKNRE